MVKLSD